MKNIAYIVNSLNLGGTENLVVQMSLAFQQKFGISVICLDEPGIWAQKLRDHSIPVFCFWRQPGLDLAMAMKIATFCRNHRISLIHAHQCTPWFYGALSRLFYSKPKLLFEEHGRHYPEVYSWKKYWVNKILIQNLTGKIVAVSKDVGRRLVKYEGIGENRVDVVYNGVHPPPMISEKERAALRHQLNLSESDLIIGSVGRLDPIKNYPMLLNALAEAKKKLMGIKIKGLLVGDGPDRVKLQHLAESLKISEEIIFSGYRRNATDLLQCMDIFVLCSFSEGTSMALLEAMAAGVPAIVTDVGGNPELIIHGRNGWVVPSDSSGDLSAAIIDACSTLQKRRQMAENAMTAFRSLFSFDQMVRKYEEIYDSMLRINNKKRGKG